MTKETRKRLLTRKELESMHPGKAIEEYIAHTDISTEELAQRLEITPAALQRILHGEAGLSRDMMRKLSRVTDTPLDNWIEIQRRYEDALDKFTTKEYGLE